MRNIVIGFGLVLVVIGVIGYFGAGMQHWTALIPTFFGGLLLAVASLPGVARREGVLAGLSVAVAALLLFGSAGALAHLPAALGGDAEVNAPAVLARGATAVVAILAVLAVPYWWLQRRRSAVR